jgi:DNA-binding transcriptional regulator YdaS (Cro superfamily)
MTITQLSPKDALLAAIDATPGGQAGLARLVGITVSKPGAVVWAWLARGQAPTEWCPAIERITAVTCEVLRPDVAWVRVPDLSWPHASGRPCLDLASMVAA